MPPARPPLASQPVFRLNATLVFKQTEYRGAQRIYAQLVDSRQRKWDKVWLSLDDPLARLEAIMSLRLRSMKPLRQLFSNTVRATTMGVEPVRMVKINLGLSLVIAVLSVLQPCL